MTENRTRALTPDVAIPYLGFGTYLIPNAEASDAVYEAMRAGYRAWLDRKPCLRSV